MRIWTMILTGVNEDEVKKVLGDKVKELGGELYEVKGDDAKEKAKEIAKEWKIVGVYDSDTEIVFRITYEYDEKYEVEIDGDWIDGTVNIEKEKLEEFVDRITK